MNESRDRRFRTFCIMGQQVRKGKDKLRSERKEGKREAKFLDPKLSELVMIKLKEVKSQLED